MGLTRDIEALYRGHGARHLLPFIGRAFDTPKANELRVVVVGINACLSPKDWRAAPPDVGTWFRNWWTDAGHGKDTWPFY
jgi:hypothetical protein